MGIILQVGTALIAALEASKYFLVFLGSYLEGSFVMMTSGFLIHSGYLAVWPTFFALYAGDLLSDITLYFIGYYGARTVVKRWGYYFGITNTVIDKIEGRFQHYHTWILIISKLTMGFGFAYATLITAGIMKVPFRRYVTINALGAFIWIPFLMTVGYFFGNIFEHIPQELKIIFIVVLLAAIVTLIHYMQRRLKEL